MAFRFRKSLGFGFGRINLSKSGASLSVGARGNVVNFGRRGVRHTVGIPGTGMSWSHKIGGGRRAASYSNNDEALTQFYDSSELCEADLEVAEAEYHEMDLLVSKAEAILTQYPGVEPKEEDVARVETMRAQRHQRRVMLDQYHRKLRRGRAQVRALQAKRIIKGAIMFAIFLWIWSAWEKVQQDKAEAVAIQQHQVQQEPVPEPVPLPRAKPQ